MSELKTEAEVRQELAVFVRQYVSDAAAARILDISRSHLCRVLQGTKPITARVAERLGYQQHIGYRSVRRAGPR